MDTKKGVCRQISQSQFNHPRFFFIQPIRMSNNSSSGPMKSYTPAPRYIPPSVPLAEFAKDNIDIKVIDLILEKAQKLVSNKLFRTVKLVSDMANGPLPLLAEDMDISNGKIVLYDPKFPYDPVAYEAAKKSRSGKWPRDVARPRRIAAITKPFLLGPRSKPNGLGNNQDKVDDKPTPEGGQKRSVLTNAYPPFSCLAASQSADDGKPYNAEMDSLVGFVSNFRRNVCEYLCTHPTIEFKSDTKTNEEKLAEANTELLKMKIARKNQDNAAMVPEYDKFLAKFCHANIKAPKSRSGSAERPQQPRSLEEQLEDRKNSAAQEVTRFTGRAYIVFRSRIGFPNVITRDDPDQPVDAGSFHPNPYIRSRLNVIDAAVLSSTKKNFVYSAPLIYYLNVKTMQWTQMTPEEADSTKWPEQRKLIVSVVTTPEFTPNGGPGMTMVRLPIDALLVWGVAGAHVPDDYAGGATTVSEEISDPDAIACLAGLGTTDDPENAADKFNHMPQVDFGQERRGTKRGFAENGDDPQATKRANAAVELTEGMSPSDFA